MTDRLDDLLFSIGEEQNDRADFEPDVRRSSPGQKQKEEEKERSTRRSRFVRYGAMAACAAALVGRGAAMVNSSRFKAEAPAEAAMTEECVEAIRRGGGSPCGGGPGGGAYDGGGAGSRRRLQRLRKRRRRKARTIRASKARRLPPAEPA